MRIESARARRPGDSALALFGPTRLVTDSESPVIPPCGPCLVAQSLLNDAPVARTGKKEGMVIKLVPILHSSAVDLGQGRPE